MERVEYSITLNKTRFNSRLNMKTLYANYSIFAPMEIKEILDPKKLLITIGTLVIDLEESQEA